MKCRNKKKTKDVKCANVSVDHFKQRVTLEFLN